MNRTIKFRAWDTEKIGNIYEHPNFLENES